MELYVFVVALLFFSPRIIKNYLWTNNLWLSFYDLWFNPRMKINENIKSSLLLFLLITITGVLVLLTLSSGARMIDEGVHLIDLSTFKNTFDINSIHKGPAFYGLLSLWGNFFGYSLTSLRACVFCYILASCLLWLLTIAKLKIEKSFDCFLMFLALPTLLTISVMVMSEPVAMFFLLGFLLFFLKFIDGGKLSNILVSTIALSLLLLIRHNMLIFVSPALVYLYFQNKQGEDKRLFLLYLIAPIPLVYCFIVWNGFVSPSHQSSFSIGFYPRTFIVSLIYVGMFFWPIAIDLWNTKSKSLIIAFGLVFYLVFFTPFNTEAYYTGALSEIFNRLQISSRVQAILLLPFFILGLLVLSKSAFAYGGISTTTYFFNLIFICSVLSWLILGNLYYARYAIYNILFIIPYMSAYTTSKISRAWFFLLIILNIAYVYKFAFSS